MNGGAYREYQGLHNGRNDRWQTERSFGYFKQPFNQIGHDRSDFRKGLQRGNNARYPNRTGERSGQGHSIASRPTHRHSLESNYWERNGDCTTQRVEAEVSLVENDPDAYQDVESYDVATMKPTRQFFGPGGRRSQQRHRHSSTADKGASGHQRDRDSEAVTNTNESVPRAPRMQECKLHLYIVYDSLLMSLICRLSTSPGP